jgi:hypothetical protein
MMTGHWFLRPHVDMRGVAEIPTVVMDPLTDFVGAYLEVAGGRCRGSDGAAPHGFRRVKCVGRAVARPFGHNAQQDPHQRN